jgi:hypothetical protein
MPAPSGATAKYAFPYLLESDVPDVATASQDLAQQVETEAANSAQSLRQAASSLVLPGPILTTDLVVSATSTPSMSVNVSTGGAWVPGTILAPQQGNYYFYQASLVNKAIAPNASGNPRIDSVCITVQDSDYAGSVDNPGFIQVIAGTPSGSPVAPTLPANSLLLANVAVANGAASITNGNITTPGNQAGTRLVVPKGRLVGYASMIPGPGLTPAQVVGLHADVTETEGVSIPTDNQMTIITPGPYHVTAAVQYVGPPIAAGFATVYIYVNGALARQHLENFNQGSLGGVASASVNDSITLAKGDVLTMFSMQNSGGGLNIQVAPTATWMSCVWLGQ